MYNRTQLNINLDNILYNIDNVKKRIPNGVKILGVIKADAYGHGATLVAQTLKEKCEYFGVACVEEGIELVKNGIKNPIILLGHTSTAQYKEVVEYGLQPAIFSLKEARVLSNIATEMNKEVSVHIAVDTGMSRIGYQVDEESADECKIMSELPNIKVLGIFSHFATADEKDSTKSKLQQKMFKDFIFLLQERGVNIPIKHLNNSAGIMVFDDSSYDMVRSGIITYGMYPSEEVDKSLLDIKPAMEWITHISYIKELSSGREISYGGTYKTTEKRMIATIPVGYADGYPRSLSNIGRVIVNGEYAPIVGRICMDQFMIDVTDVKDANVDDVVILVGKNGDKFLSMEEVSNLSGSFNYELPCRISRRVTKVYYKDGKEVKTTNYVTD